MTKLKRPQHLQVMSTTDACAKTGHYSLCGVSKFSLSKFIFTQLFDIKIK